MQPKVVPAGNLRAEREKSNCLFAQTLHHACDTASVKIAHHSPLRFHTSFENISSCIESLC